MTDKYLHTKDIPHYSSIQQSQRVLVALVLLF